jgi:hypothetical protein
MNAAPTRNALVSLAAALNKPVLLALRVLGSRFQQ